MQMRALRTSAPTTYLPPVLSFNPPTTHLLILHSVIYLYHFVFHHFFMNINPVTKAVMQSPQWRIGGATVSARYLVPKLGSQNWGSLCDGCGEIGSGRVRPGRSVGDVRYSLLCVHWAQCKGALTRAGNARPRSPAGPTWTLTCARTQASGPISATRASSASRRSPASIFISGRTQVGL